MEQSVFTSSSKDACRSRRVTALHSSLLTAILLLKAVAALERQSACPTQCQNYGTCYEELGRCDCTKDRTGVDCTVLADVETLKERCEKAYYPSTHECVSSDLACLNKCNRQGSCVSGFCHCKPGYFGADCSLSLGPGGKPQLLPDKGYKARQKRPWIYVYELPPELTTWVNTKRLDRSTHLHFYQRLLSSGARVADGDRADWYFIPIRLRMTADSQFLEGAVNYIRQAWPYWNRTQGHNHFVIHTGDLGTDELLQGPRRLAENVTMLTHWGLTRDKVFSGWRAAHRPQQDVVIPVYLTVSHFKMFGLERSPLHPLNPKFTRNTTFFFAGRICGDRKPPRPDTWPNCGPRSKGYSGGVRQFVHYHHWNRTGFHVVTGEKRYSDFLKSSKFCLAPLGGGHGQRQILVSFMGCVPVSIADDVYEPFEPQLDWREFALRPTEADIPRLHEIIGAISPQQLKKMQAALRCAAQHFVYSSIIGGFMGEDGRFDAFETILEVLRVKADHPDAPPDQYRELDRDFDDFMACRDPKGFKASMPQPNLYGLLGDGGAAAAAADAVAENPLCSHARPDREKKSCEAYLQGTSKTHLLPGGIICARSRDNLAACPRIWL